MNITDLSKKYFVRKLAKKDIDNILILCQGNPMYYHYCPPMATKESIEKEMVALPPHTTLKDKYYLGIFDQEKLIAILDLILNFPNQDTAFIGFFMIKAEYQNIGLGTRLIKEITECLLENGYHYIRLGYVKNNPQAKAFWLKNGFEATGVESKTANYTIVYMQQETQKGHSFLFEG